MMYEQRLERRSKSLTPIVTAMCTTFVKEYFLVLQTNESFGYWKRKSPSLHPFFRLIEKHLHIYFFEISLYYFDMIRISLFICFVPPLFFIHHNGNNLLSYFLFEKHFL